MTKKEFYDLCQTHFGHCGCGCPEEVATLIRDVLISFKEMGDARKALLPGVYGEPSNYAEWFLLYQLDGAGLLEHGTNIRWSWLTNEGIELVQALETYDEWLSLMTGNIAWVDDKPHVMDTNTLGAPIENWDAIACAK